MSSTFRPRRSPRKITRDYLPDSSEASDLDSFDLPSPPNGSQNSIIEQITPNTATTTKDSAYGRDLGTEMVDILVADEKEPFRVHKNLLYAKAPYYQLLFNRLPNEVVDEKKPVAEGDPLAFSLFLEWIYKGSCEPTKAKKDEPLQEAIRARVYLWVMAEKLSLPDLQDYAMTMIIDAYCKAVPSCRQPTLETSKLIYSICEPQSAFRVFGEQAKLRQFVAECLAFSISSWKESKNSTSESLLQHMTSHSDLALDTLRAMRDGANTKLQWPITGPKCRFHLHEIPGPCPYQ